MASAAELLLSGIILGLVQGLTPGPLITLVISETFRFGKGEGFKVAVSPFITDSTIILITLTVLSTLEGYGAALGIISVFGACYLIYLGFENLRFKITVHETKVVKREALKRAVIANFLNPHTYLFWLFVGGPIILKNIKTNPSAIVFFLLGFYFSLIGSKSSIALVMDKSKSLLKSRYYPPIIRLLGIILMVFAVSILIDGLRLMTIF